MCEEILKKMGFGWEKYSKDRFFLRNGYIVDNLTGKKYENLNEICKLLNDINKRADKNAEHLSNIVFNPK